MAVIAESKAADWYINDGVGSKTFELTGPSEVSLAEQFCEVYGDWVSNGSADSSYHHSGRYYDTSGPTMSFDLMYEFGCHNESSSPVHNTWHTIPHFQMIRYAVPAGPSEPEDLGGSCQVNSTMPSPLVLDPIHSKTGNSFQIDVDFNDGAKGLLKFTRYYNSASEKYPESIMGNGWRHTYERRILRKNYNYVTAIRPDGKGHVWKNNGLGYVSESDKSSKLSFVNWNWWVLETKDGWKETYDAFGKLLSLEHISGENIDLTYNERSQLVTLTDNVGRYIELTYNSLGKLESFRDTTGNIYKYEYGAEGNLTGVIYPDLTQSDDSDNPKKTYHYENVDHPTYLTGITNENGVRYASWTYDDQGRAISNEHAGIEVGSLQYVDGNNTVVSGSLGEQRTIASVTINKISRPASISRKACANCAVDTQSYTFDHCCPINA